MNDKEVGMLENGGVDGSQFEGMDIPRIRHITGYVALSWSGPARAI